LEVGKNKREETGDKNKYKEIKCLVTVFGIIPDKIKIKKQSIASD